MSALDATLVFGQSINLKDQLMAKAFHHLMIDHISVVMDPGIGIQRSDSLALFCGRKKIRIFKARILIFVAQKIA
jgi:hypothetical protein